MAGAGYKLFNTGDVLTAAQVNTYLQEQTVMVFADSAARTTALSGVLAEGMVSYLQDTNAVEVYNGSAWVGVSGAGDVTEVQAGTGISVASGTGPIPVVTNTMATAFDAAGDLIYGTGSDTFAKLSLGTAGQVLKVNSGATAPEWGAAAGGSSFVGCSVYYTANQSLISGTQTAIAYTAEDFDTDAIHDNSTNNTRFTIPSGKSGKWSFTFRIYFSPNSAGGRYLLPRKNGTVIKAMEADAKAAGAQTEEINFILDLVAGDYIENFALQTSGSTLNAQTDKEYIEASCFYLGA